MTTFAPTTAVLSTIKPDAVYFQAVTITDAVFHVFVTHSWTLSSPNILQRTILNGLCSIRWRLEFSRTSSGSQTTVTHWENGWKPTAHQRHRLRHEGLRCRCQPLISGVRWQQQRILSTEWDEFVLQPHESDTETDSYGTFQILTSAPTYGAFWKLSLLIRRRVSNVVET